LRQVDKVEVQKIKAKGFLVGERTWCLMI